MRKHNIIISVDRKKNVFDNVMAKYATRRSISSLCVIRRKKIESISITLLNYQVFQKRPRASTYPTYRVMRRAVLIVAV